MKTILACLLLAPCLWALPEPATGCPKSITLTAGYAGAVNQDGTGATVLSAQYSPVGTQSARALIIGFNFAGIPSGCRITSARYAYSTRRRSSTGLLYTMRGLLGGDGRPTGNIVQDLLRARSVAGGGLLGYAQHGAHKRWKYYVTPEGLEALNARAAASEWANFVLQPAGPISNWVEVYTHHAGKSRRPTITLWLEGV